MREGRFGVPLRGSLHLFLGLSALFLLSEVAIGVPIAAVSRTLQQAPLFSFFGLFPMMFLSGALAPVESMPGTLQTLSLVSPLRHYMDVILGVFLKGARIADLWPQTLALLAIGVPLFAGAAYIFRRGAPRMASCARLQAGRNVTRSPRPHDVDGLDHIPASSWVSMV